MSVDSVAVKLPFFTPSDVDGWFIIVEAQFRLRKITSDATKADHIITGLGDKVTQILSWVRKQPNPADLCYSELKREVYKQFTLSPTQRAQQLIHLSEEALGDITPKQWRDEMGRLLSLPEGGFIDITTEIFLRRLPPCVREKIVNAHTRSLDDIAEEAEALWVSSRAAQRNKGSVFAAAEAESYEDECINLVSRRRPHQRAEVQRSSAVWSRRRFDSRKPEERATSQTFKMTLSKNGFCPYHEKFGENAKRCFEGCCWPNPKNGSGRQ